jgi:CRISPR-associated protein Cmr2
MIFDLYVQLDGESQQDIDALVKGEYREIKLDVPTRIRLLAGIAARGDRGRGGYKSLVHASNAHNTPYAGEISLIMQDYPWLTPSPPPLDKLPFGSFFLQYTFTLAKPWMSKDDDPFYVAESINPVRKDKVFKVPCMAASSWKGLLRWTMMHILLARKKDALTDKEFAQERLRQSLLFGDEKGEEPGQVKDFAAYLDSLKPTARQEYVRLLRTRYNLKDDDPLPHHAGRLMFYPTFFDLIDVEVINPHKRETKAGTYPIYLECVPAGAKGTFSLFYVPFDLIGRPEEEVKNQAAEDLQRIAEAVSAMMLTYGFSAKRTSGYGTAEDEIDGYITTRAGKQPVRRLSKLVEEVANVTF